MTDSARAVPATPGTPVTGSRPRRRRRRGIRVALVAGVLAVLAVAMPSGAEAATGVGTPPGKAWVRVGHFVPGMGATSITLRPLGVSQAPISVVRHASYGDVSAYGTVAPGSYVVDVAMSDAAPGSAPMLSRSLKVKPGQARTLAILGTAAAPRLAVLSDDLTPPSPGTARVRLLSATSGAQAVTVSAIDGPTIAADAVPGQATDYATVPAGSWTLQVQNGADTGTLQSVPIASGSVYTVVVLDQGADTVRLDVVTDAAGATTTPKGGAKTGLGGMAPGLHDVSVQQHPSRWLSESSAVLVVVAIGLVLGCRRRVRAVT